MKALLSLLFFLSPGFALPKPGEQPEDSITNTDQAKHTIYASHYSGRVYALQFDSSSGQLSEAQNLKTCGKKPSWLTIDHESNTLYCLDEAEGNEPSHVFAYSIKSDGTLEETARVDTLSGAVHAAIYGEKKKFIAIASSRAAAVQTFALPLKESSKPLQTIDYSSTEYSKPYGVYVDPNRQSSVFVLDKGAAYFYVYAVDDDEGHLAGCQIRDAYNDYGYKYPIGIRRAAFTKAGNDRSRLHLIDDIQNSVLHYDVSYTNNTLQQRDQNSTGKPEGCPYVTIADVQWVNYTPENLFIPDTTYLAEIKAINDRDVYATYCGDRFFESDDSVMEICETMSGEFSCGYKYEEEYLKNDGILIAFARKLSPSYGQCPRSFDPSPDGSFLAFANRISSTVAIVQRDAESHGVLGGLVAEIHIGTEGAPRQRNGLSSVVWGRAVGA